MVSALAVSNASRSGSLSAQSQASLIDSTSQLVDSVGERLQEQNDFLLNWSQESFSKMLEQAERMNIHGHLRQTGLYPYLGDPESQVQRDIEAVVENLGVTHAEAVEYLRRGLSGPTAEQMQG